MATVEVTLPTHLPSRANERVHWAKRQKRSRFQRDMAYLCTREALNHKERPRLPITVTLTRISPRLLDDDNLRGAFKSIRDGIADLFKVADSPSGPITWRYTQLKGKPARVTIEIEGADAQK